MGLPTSIPSGGDGRDTFSSPQAKNPRPQNQAPSASADGVPRRRQARPESRSAAQSSETLSEFEEFKRWKAQKRREAQRASEPEKTALPSTREPSFERDETVDEIKDGALWRTDPKTGKRYKVLMATPKEALVAYRRNKGALPIEQLMKLIEVDEDFAIDDLNGTAEKFMAHLRVPPSPEEKEALIRKKQQMAKAQEQERAALDQELEEKFGSLEPEKDPFGDEPKPKRGFLSKNRTQE